MRTTIDIPEELYRKLKIKAAKDGSTLREVVLNSVMKVVSPDIKEGEENWRPWYSALKEYRDEIHEMQKFIDNEFSKIDPEDWK